MVDFKYSKEFKVPGIFGTYLDHRLYSDTGPGGKATIKKTGEQTWERTILVRVPVPDTITATLGVSNVFNVVEICEVGPNWIRSTITTPGGMTSVAKFEETLYCKQVGKNIVAELKVSGTNYAPIGAREVIQNVYLEYRIQDIKNGLRIAEPKPAISQFGGGMAIPQ